MRFKKVLARRSYTQRQRRGSLLLRLAVCFFVAYIIFLLIQTQIQINQKKSEVEALQAEVQLTMSEINELERIATAESEDEYMERIAREQLGYVSGDERVFMDINAGR